MSAVLAGLDPAAATASIQVMAYYPGCSLHGTSREFDESLRAVLPELGVALAEIDDWSCCGASSGHTTDHLLGVALPARNLALAEAQGYDNVLAPCAACYNRLSAARLAVSSEEGMAERIPDVLGRPFANSVDVQNVVQLLQARTSTIKERVGAHGPNPLADVKMAAYYGCLLVRPESVCGSDDPEDPTSMDEVITAAGAEPVAWNYKVECCGGAFSVSRTTSVVRLGRAIVNDARAHGAEAIVVACPLCHSNLDLRQKAMLARGEKPLPILFITEVVGLALGLPAAALGVERHFVDAQPFLRRGAQQAVARAAAEQRAKEEAAAKAAAKAAARDAEAAGAKTASAGEAPAASDSPDGDA